MKSEEITKIREKWQLSTSKYASMIGVTYMTMSKWESGKTSPKLSHRILLELSSSDKGYHMLRDVSRRVRQDMFDEEMAEIDNNEEVNNG